LVSAFAAGAGLVLGQRATAEKSNGIAAIPELLSTLALAGCTVTIDAMGAQTAIAEAIRNRGADYVPAVKDNQPKLAESIEDFWRSFRAHPRPRTPRTRLQRQWARTMAGWKHAAAMCSIDWNASINPVSGAGCAALRCLNRSASSATRLPASGAYTSPVWLPTPNASATPSAPLGGREPLTPVHGCVARRRPDARQNQGIRGRTKASAHNPAVLRHLALNLIRLDPIKRKGGVKARTLIAATSDNFRAELLGLR
jgi:hypothetical protein